ncbi:MAG TPA: choice-of-anchor D domain-containing protein [Anaeromyxobacter sp.]
MIRSPFTGALAALVLAAWAPRALAHPTYYGSYCSPCHGASVTTCNGCHHHGTHASATATSSISVSGTLDSTIYAPGATVTVTITGGDQSGWVRTLLYDQNMKELARSSCPGGTGGCTTTGYPVTLTATAPATPGTYTWAVAWYGNAQYESAGASFGNGTSSTLQPGSFTPDANNPNHGYQVVALTPFTVSAAATPAIGVAPGSLAFGTVTVGGSASKTFTITSTGTGTLTGTVALAGGTSTEYTASPATFSLASGASQVVTVTYAPIDTTSDAGAVVVSSNDPANPSVSVALSGAGTTAALPAIALSPAALDFGTVGVGTSSSLAAQIRNTGAAALTVASIDRCTTPATSTDFAWSAPSAAPFTVAAGQAVTLTVSFAPSAAGAEAGCLVVTSDDPQNPTVQLTVGGTGGQPAPIDTVARPSGGCSSSAGAAGAAALLLAALALRLGGGLRRRERAGRP